MAKMGRPEKPIDWNMFEQLCHIQCTHDEIASMLHVSKDTLYRQACKKYKFDDFPTIYKKFTENGKCSLRRLQIKHANKSAAMSIWLGKQYLGQKDHQDPITNSVPRDELILANQKILELNYQLREAKDALQRQADPKLQPSDSPV